MLENYNDVITVKQLCEILGICRNTANKYINNGMIKAKKIDSKIFILKDSVIEFMEKD